MSDKQKRGRFADLVDAIHGWWTKKGGEGADDARREVNEEITRALPDPVNASSAVAEGRRRKKKLIDDAFASSDD